MHHLNEFKGAVRVPLQGENATKDVFEKLLFD